MREHQNPGSTHHMKTTARVKSQELAVPKESGVLVGCWRYQFSLCPKHRRDGAGRGKQLGLSVWKGSVERSYAPEYTSAKSSCELSFSSSLEGLFQG